MADNVTAPATGAVFASDDVGGVQYPRVKIAFGADGSASDVNTGNALPVALDAASLAALENTTVTGPLTNAELRASAVPVSISGTVATASGANPVIQSNTITLSGAFSYAIGVLIGGSASANNSANRLQFASAAPAGGSIKIARARLYKSQATNAGGFRLWLFRGDPAAALSANNAAVSTGTAIGNSTATVRLIGRIDFDGPSGTVGSDGAVIIGVPLEGPRIVATLAAGQTDLFGVIECRSPYSGLSGETFSVTLELE